MSNNLVSQQLPIPNGDMGQLQPTYSNVDPSISDMQMGMMGSMSNESAPHQFAISNQQMQLVDTMSYIPGSQNLPMSDTQLGHMDTMVDNMEPQKLLPNQNDGGMEAMFLGSQKLFPTKRKAAGEPMSNSLVPQQLSIPNKRAAHMQPPLSSPELLHHHGPNKKTVQSQSMLRSAAGPQKSPSVNKKMARNESISTKSGSQRAQTPKGRTIQMETMRKGQSESSEAVRSKMRESLAGALALVCQDQNITPKQEKSPPQAESITPMQTEQSKPAEPAPVPLDAADASEKSIQFSGQDSIYNTVLPEGDVSFTDSFFVKDELLQGNGLSWAWDMDMVQPVKQLDAGNDLNEQKVRSPEDLAFKTEEKELQTAKNGVVGGDGGEKNLRSPKDLAFKIELELFKLFGGVNKKYKEKGRSLMFNLKDKNNPELRERVMSGEISPEKLCSMTAEELASKELSEWRTAKAEELAQMIVLPESDGDRRRLVKKTHKGEYQVEVEQDDSASVEVSVGSTTFTQARPKVKETAGPSSENEVAKDQKNVEGEKGGMENQDASYSLTIPADGTDLMQGLIEDEFKDAELLPPIVSLDEFMESLNTEPPFDILSVDATGQTKPLSDKEKSESNNKPVASDLVDTKPGKFPKLDAKVAELEVEVEVKSSDSPVDKKHSSPDIASKAEHVWEGALQLHISALVTVIGLFRSGEKTSTREWPSSLEIKGRVRLDAFEKFVQELPMSRSRAVMVVQFVLKAGSSGDERASIREVVDSYVLDERLGFAEPATGVELYLCPTHPKILDLLGRHLVKDQNEIVNSTTDNGLIGVVVWRKPHIISPNSTSHHKHGSSKKQQHFTSRRHEKDTNVNSNLTSRTPVPFTQKTHTRPGPTPDDDEDDIPPGFGPGAQRDDDDLPEFNFSGNSNSSGPSRISSHPSRVGYSPVPSQSSRPVDKMRELVQKYGQTVQGTSQGWNDDDDDDDDIPEWRPEDPHQRTRGFHQPMQPHVVNQSLRSLAPHLHLLGQRVVSPPPPPVAAVPHPTSMMHNATNPRWVHPQGFQASNVGQFHGVPPQSQPGNWRRDVPRSRGF